MSLLRRAFHALFADADLRGLTDEQSRAVLDLLNLALLADSQVSDAEIRAIFGEAAQLPWSIRPDQRRLDDMLQRSRHRMAELDGPAREAVVRQSAHALPAGAAREKVARMMLVVCGADGIVESERILVATFAAEAGISPTRIAEMTAEVTGNAFIR